MNLEKGSGEETEYHEILQRTYKEFARLIENRKIDTEAM